MNNPDHPILLTDLSCLSIHGADAQDFLQSQLTIDVTKLLPEQSRLGAYCEPKGRVISTFILTRMDDIFFMIIPAALTETLLNTLHRYRFRAKVDFEVPAGIAVHGYYPESCTTGPHITNQSFGFPHPMDKQRGFILQPAQGTSQGTGDVVNDDTNRRWKLADITAGMVWLDQRTTVRHLPQSLCLVDNNAVDFDKGCYPGQEIIARLKYLGQSKYTTCQFTAELDCADFIHADRVRDSSGRRQGQRLNSSCYKQNLNGLAVVKHTALAAGTELFLTDREGNPVGTAIKPCHAAAKTC